MRKFSGEALIDLAVQILKSDIRPNVPAENRYALAMTISALEIARREWLNDPESTQLELLDAIYDDGDGSLDKLSRDIRNNTINDQTHPELLLATQSVQICLSLQRHLPWYRLRVSAGYRSVYLSSIDATPQNFVPIV